MLNEQLLHNIVTFSRIAKIEAFSYFSVIIQSKTNLDFTVMRQTTHTHTHILFSFPPPYQIIWDNCKEENTVAVLFKTIPESSWRGSAGWTQRLRLSDFRFFPAAADCQYCLESILREAYDSWILHTVLLPLTEEMRWIERNNSERAATSGWNNTEPAGRLVSHWLEKIA